MSNLWIDFRFDFDVFQRVLMLNVDVGNFDWIAQAYTQNHTCKMYSYKNTKHISDALSYLGNRKEISKGVRYGFVNILWICLYSDWHISIVIDSFRRVSKQYSIFMSNQHSLVYIVFSLCVHDYWFHRAPLWKPSKGNLVFHTPNIFIDAIPSERNTISCMNIWKKFNFTNTGWCQHGAQCPVPTTANSYHFDFVYIRLWRVHCPPQVMLTIMINWNWNQNRLRTKKNLKSILCCANWRLHQINNLISFDRHKSHFESIHSTAQRPYKWNGATRQWV